MNCKSLSALICLPLLSLTALAATNAIPPPIKAVSVKPKATVFAVAARKKPIVIKSEKEAAGHFGDDALAKLMKSVDFEKQFVLVFAWRGSGQDKLEFSVAESFPEQIFFKIRPGRTRDLRPHTHVFALRSNVRWSIK